MNILDRHSLDVFAFGQGRLSHPMWWMIFVRLVRLILYPVQIVVIAVVAKPMFARTIMDEQLVRNHLPGSEIWKLISRVHSNTLCCSNIELQSDKIVVCEVALDANYCIYSKNIALDCKYSGYNVLCT